MHTATVICIENGNVIKTYKFPYPETQDESRVARPSKAQLESQARDKLFADGLTTPTTWNDIKFSVTYSS